jgi:uncharacterized protein (TIGR02598 family)
MCAERSVCGRRGFSLVEVVLAIGLMMFALLVIFSLIPTGLGVLHDAGRQVVETEIFNAVGAELAATPFTNMDGYQSSNALVYYDVEGRKVAADRAVFHVRCDLAAAEFVTAENPAGELRRATVRIGFRQDPTNAQKPARRTILLGNRGL